MPQIIVDHEGGFHQIKAPRTVVGGNQDLSILLELLDDSMIRTAVVQQGFVLALQ